MIEAVGYLLGIVIEVGIVGIVAAIVALIRVHADRQPL